MKPFNYHIPVLMYHRVVNHKKEAGKHNIYVTQKNLIRQFDYLKNQGYQTVTFNDLSKLTVNTKKVILTFDDGYVDNYTLLFPLLKKYNFTAVIFLVTRLSCNEWGIVEGEPSVEMMNEAQLKEMHAYGIEFGGHTQTHVDLTLITEEQLRNEIAGCKNDVEKILGTPVKSFSYPFGALNEQVKLVVKKSGFKYGISTNTGPDNLLDDLLQVKRIEISCNTRFARFKKKVSGSYFEPSFFKRIFYK